MFKLAGIIVIIVTAFLGSSMLRGPKSVLEKRPQSQVSAQSQPAKAGPLKTLNSSEPMLLLIIGVCLIASANLLPRMRYRFGRTSSS